MMGLQIITTEGMEAEDTKAYVADLITRQLHQESFQLKPEQVCSTFMDVHHTSACELAIHVALLSLSSF